MVKAYGCDVPELWSTPCHSRLLHRLPLVFGSIFYLLRSKIKIPTQAVQHVLASEFHALRQKWGWQLVN